MELLYYRYATVSHGALQGDKLWFSRIVHTERPAWTVRRRGRPRRMQYGDAVSRRAWGRVDVRGLQGTARRPGQVRIQPGRKLGGIVSTTVSPKAARGNDSVERRILEWMHRFQWRAISR